MDLSIDYVTLLVSTIHSRNTLNVEESIQQAAKVISEADALFITAGAGMGVDSGLPDFRGNEGFWQAYPPMAKLGVSFSQMADPDWFRKDPSLAWGFYGHRWNLYQQTTPHDGFRKLLDLGKSKPGEYFVFTSNVDGHFQKAGYSEDRIEECHGSLNYLQCCRPCSDAIWDTTDLTIEIDEETFRAQDPLPTCPNCGALARPNVLMFGDWLWVSNHSDIQGLRLAGWIDELRANEMRLAVVEIGAGKAVPTVRYQSEHAAAHFNGTLVRINPRDYEVPDNEISIPLGGLEGINRISKLVRV